MTRVICRKFGAHCVGIREEFETLAGPELINAIAERPKPSRQTLGGRASISYCDLPEVGSVAIKHYMRGGIFGKAVPRRYLKWGPTRGELEFAFLEEVRALGVHAPLPVAFVWRGSPFYQAWLITSVIPDTVNLAQLSRQDEDRACRLLVELVRQISILVQGGIWHIDLHPGNVLVGKDDTLYLVDFDKAGHFNGSKYELRDRYLFRWRRAVIKHQLPEVLSEIVCLGLRSYHEEHGERFT